MLSDAPVGSLQVSFEMLLSSDSNSFLACVWFFLQRNTILHRIDNLISEVLAASQICAPQAGRRFGGGGSMVKNSRWNQATAPDKSCKTCQACSTWLVASLVSKRSIANACDRLRILSSSAPTWPVAPCGTCTSENGNIGFG